MEGKGSPYTKFKSLRKNLDPEFSESLDTLLSKTKKKLPKIEEEKRILREKQTKEKTEELAKLKTKDLLFKFDDVVFTSKKGEYEKVWILLNSIKKKNPFHFFFSIKPFDFTFVQISAYFRVNIL